LPCALAGITALLIVNLAFGVVSRAAPSLNLFAVGFPVSLVVGLLVVLVRHRARCRELSPLLAPGSSSSCVRFSGGMIHGRVRRRTHRTSYTEAPRGGAQERASSRIRTSCRWRRCASRPPAAIYTLGDSAAGKFAELMRGSLSLRPQQAVGEDVIWPALMMRGSQRAVDILPILGRHVHRRARRTARHRRLEFLGRSADAEILAS
jgi:hypothetical protein